MQTILIDIEIPAELDQHRLDQALSNLCTQYSRSQIQQWIKEGCVQVNGKIEKKPRFKALVNQQVHIEVVLTLHNNWEAENIPLKVVYVDDDLLVIDKPAGLVVHPGAGNAKSTLVNALINYDPQLAALPRAGLVHRLDKNTTGLLVIARNLPTHFQLIKDMQNRLIKREYLAIVNGVMVSGGTINTFMGRHPQQRTRMSVLKSGKQAITHYRVQKRFQSHTLVQVQLETGRTHQIRVHLAHIHYPIVGDAEYGRRGITEFHRQALHAAHLSLSHPRTQEAMHWESPLPEDMQNLLDSLKEKQ